MGNQHEPDFVSRQTFDARRFYLNLSPRANESLEVVCGGVERMQADYVVQRYDFPYYAIEWVTEGEGELHLDGHSFPLSPGVLFAYGPGIAHRIANLPPTKMRKYYLDLAGQNVASQLQGLGLLGGRPITVARSFELVDLLNMIDREAREDGKESLEICSNLAQTLLLKIKQRTISHTGELTVAFQTYETVRASMEQRFLEFRTVEDVAEENQISGIYLSRLFKRFAGTGAYRFLLRLRMNYAAELLLEHNLLVKEVAERLEYSDPFQFSRAFKRIYGVAPKALIDARKDH